MSLLDLVQQQLGAGGTEQIAGQIGADPSTTQNAIQAAVPMLLGGMAGNARQPGGLDAITGMMGQTGGMGGLGGMLGGLLGGGAGGGGGLGGLAGMLGGGGLGGMLGGLLGQHEETVTDGVQQASGLSGNQTRQLLMILAPMALAALAHQRSQSQQAQSGVALGAESGGADDLNGNGIPDELEQHARQAQAQSGPHIGGLVGKILGSFG